MADLKPCPFCGETEHLMVQHLEGTVLHPAYRVICDNCGASSAYTDQDHVAVWNLRAPDPRDEVIRGLVEAAEPFVAPMQTADFARQLRQHEALVAALAAARKLVRQPYMGQIMAECDCPRQDECQRAGRCIAEARNMTGKDE